LLKYILPVLFTSLIFAQSNDFLTIYDLMTNGEYEEAIKKIENIKSNKRSIKSTKHYLLGISHARIQNFGPSLKNFVSAIKYGNKGKDIFYEMGQSFYANNDFLRAIKAFQKSIKLRYKPHQSHYYIGHIYQLMEEYAKAKVYFNNVIKIPNGKVEIKQAALFQLAESLLSLARHKMSTKHYVEKFVIKYMEQARDLDKKSAIAKDIERRIIEVKREFFLDPDLMYNGRLLPKKKWSGRLSQGFEFDDNHTLANDLPGNQQAQLSTYIIDTLVEVEKIFSHDKTYTYSPGFQFHNKYHTDRNNAQVYGSDIRKYTPYVKSTYEFKLFKRQARVLLDYEYEYETKDIDNNETLKYNSSTHILRPGLKLEYYKGNPTTAKAEYRLYTYHDDSLNHTSLSLSVDQQIRTKKNFFLAMAYYQIKSYETASQNDNSMLYLRTDYIRPGFMKLWNLNVAVSAMRLDYKDAQTAAEKGTETTLMTSLKLLRNINERSSFDVEYEFTKNTSDSESSNYNKNVFSIEYNLKF
jgi:tetratricopeptide (TPR) repeat protein